MKRELALSAVVLYDQYFIAVRSIEINAHHVLLMRAMRAAATAQFQAGRGSPKIRCRPRLSSPTWSTTPQS